MEEHLENFLSDYVFYDSVKYFADWCNDNYLYRLANCLTWMGVNKRRPCYNYYRQETFYWWHREGTMMFYNDTNKLELDLFDSLKDYINMNDRYWQHTPKDWKAYSTIRDACLALSNALIICNYMSN